MPIRSFSVGPKKSLKLAKYDNLPDLVVVTGANGAGKSSLLNLLRSARGINATDKVLYIGAYRPWRKGAVSKSSVLSLALTYNQFLGEPSIPHGMSGTTIQNFQGQTRDGDSSDEVNSIVKLSLAKLEEGFKDRLARIYNENGEIRKGEIGDPFSPVKKLIGRLLPHLNFVGVEDNKTTYLSVLFRSAFRPDAEPFDIDELSAGEKAIVSLFLPVLEFQIEKIIGTERPENARTFLIDEPELHLHPALQADMLAYMRELTATENIQFIMASHSPPIIEASSQEELFMVLPWQEVEGANQFVPVADSFDRLVAIKELTGSAFAYSRGRPIIFIEGEYPQDTKKATDLGILELVAPEMRGYIVVPSRGKNQVIDNAKAVRRAAAEQGHVTTAFALVDGDYKKDARPWVISWPVCMVENLLIDPKSIAKILSPYRAQGADDESGIDRYLSKLLFAMEDEEIERRLKIDAGPIIGRPSLSDDGRIEYDLAAVTEQARQASDKVEAARQRVRDEVTAQLHNGTAALHFHGKTLIRRLYDEKIARYIPHYTNFIFYLASTIATDSRLTKSASDAISLVRRFFPPDLTPFLQKEDITEFCASQQINTQLLQKWAKDRDAYFNSSGTEPEKNFVAERELIRLLSALNASGKREWYQELRPLVVDCISR